MAETYERNRLLPNRGIIPAFVWDSEESQEFKIRIEILPNASLEHCHYANPLAL
jgi:hypothetical protein